MEQEKVDKTMSRERRSSRKNEQAVGSAASEPRRGPKSCSSHYKGVTKHRRTGRWEAHIWGRSVNKGPGKQIYLGGFVTPEEAAEAHDLAALQLQGPNAKTNFHISKYAEWLATLQATPSEDNLPLQLRRAGMFKRCTDRAKHHPPGFTSAAHFQMAGEPNTPLNAEVKARLSRASDSTQTGEVGTSNLTYFEREESVNSQSSGQGPPAPGAIRRPMPVRLGMPMGGDGHNGGENLHQRGPSQLSLQQSQQPQRQAAVEGAPQSLSSRGIVGTGGPSAPGNCLDSRVVPQLVPLGWKSFQALAEEQAQAQAAAAAAAAAAAVQHASKGMGSNPMQIAPLLSTAPLPSHFYQLPPEGPSFMNTSANGGIVYGHKHYLGFLSPEQVRWLEASGVKFPEHLQLPKNSSPSQPLPGLSSVESGAPPTGFALPANSAPQMAGFSGIPLPFSAPQAPGGALPAFLSPPQPLAELRPPVSAPVSESVPPASTAPESGQASVPEASEPVAMETEEAAPQPTEVELSRPQESRPAAAQPEAPAADQASKEAEAELQKPVPLSEPVPTTEPPAQESGGPMQQGPSEALEANKVQDSPAPQKQDPEPRKRESSQEDKQVVEALLGLRAAK